MTVKALGSQKCRAILQVIVISSEHTYELFLKLPILLLSPMRSFTVIKRSAIALKVFSGVKMDIGSKYFISTIKRTILSIIWSK